MQDDFADHAIGLSAPATRAEAIVPDDTADLGAVTRALYVGQGGDLRVTMVSGQTLVLANMQGGAIYPLRIRRVHATGTLASDIVGLS